ncbi:hypothetical protein Tco_1428624 [Tanacetum coccineum]
MAGSEIIIHHTTHPSQTPTQQTPHIVSTTKLPILKKGEYDIWAMKMEHYLAHTDYPIWEVIQRGNGPVSVSTDTNGLIKVLPPKTAEEILARERERKARTTLLMALPEDHLAKFHKMTDAKEMWEAIKSRFGEGLHKGYDRFQSLLSQLEIHGAGVSIEDANQKFLRSLPSDWSQVSLIMRTRMSGQSQFDDRSGNQDGRRRDTWNTGNKDKEDRKRSETEDISLSDLVGVQTQRNAEKEKEDLKAKVEKWHNSSKNLNILLNSQMSARDKAAAWFGDQLIKDSIYINAARQVITVKPIVNNARPKVGFHKSVSPFRKSFNRTTALRTKFSKQKVNTAEVNAVSVVKGKKETAVKSSAVMSRHMMVQGLPCLIIKGLNVALVALEEVKMCDKNIKWFFAMTLIVLVLSPEFKLPDENQVLLRIPRQNNMYSFNLENIVPSRGTLLNYVGQKGSRDNIVMPELYNKMELLRGRT